MIFCTDIHIHLLPGVDDGARDQEICMKMLQAARAGGTQRVIVTPHNKPMHRNAEPERIWELTEQVQRQAKESGLDMALYPGNEIYYRSEVPELLGQGKICTLAGSDYVLIEFSPGEDFAYIKTGVNRLLAEGYRPILAHAERYSQLYASMERAKSLTRTGCYLQVNAGSIMGRYGFRMRGYCRRLLRQGLVHFVASDAHDTDRRAPGLCACADYIIKRLGQREAERIFQENPSRIIANEYI